MAGETVLSASVGAGGGNQAPDVGLVQIFLNVMRGMQKRSLLQVDGVCGPLTVAAIREFQKDFTGQDDGRVDPRGPTLRALIYSYITIMRAGVQMYPFPPSFMELATRERPEGTALGALLRDGLKDLKLGLIPFLTPGGPSGPKPSQPNQPPKPSHEIDIS